MFHLTVNGVRVTRGGNMQGIRVKKLTVLSLLLAVMVSACSSGYAKVHTYWYGSIPTSEDGLKRSSVFWRVEQSGNSVVFYRACQDNTPIFRGNMIDATTIVLGIPGTTTTIGKAVLNGSSMVITNTVAANPAQPPLEMNAVEGINCGKEGSTNAIGDSIPPQPLTFVSSSDTPAIGANGALLDCTPLTVDVTTGTTIDGDTKVSSGCLHMAQAFNVTLPPYTSSSISGEQKNDNKESCKDVGSGGGGTVCTTQDTSEATTMTLANVALYSPNPDIFPGQLLQGTSLSSLAPGLAFIPYPKAAANFYITGLTISGGDIGFSIPTPGWSGREFYNGLQAALDKNVISGQAASVKYDSFQAYSNEQINFELNATATINSVNLAASLDLDIEKTSNYTLISLIQIFYTVSFEDPSYGTSVFADGVAFEDPRGLIASNNVPLYVSSVSYGRRILLMVSSTYSSTSVAAAFKAASEGKADEETEEPDAFDVSVKAKYSDIVQQSQITYLAVGGSTEDAFSIFGDGSQDIVQPGSENAGIIKSTSESASQIYTNLSKLLSNVKAATYTNKNPGVPVAFTTKYLTNSKQASMGDSVSYAIKNCTQFYDQPVSWAVHVDTYEPKVCLYVDPVNYNDPIQCSESNVPLDLTMNSYMVDTQTKPDFKDHTFHLLLWGQGWYNTWLNNFELRKNSITAYKSSYAFYTTNTWASALDLSFTLNQGGCDTSTNTQGSFNVRGASTSAATCSKVLVPGSGGTSCPTS